MLSSPNPFIVVCRKVQQTSLGKLVGVLRKEATAFGMRFQKVRVHGKCPHSNNPFNFCTAHRFNLPRGAAIKVLLTITFWGLYMRGTRLRARDGWPVHVPGGNFEARALRGPTRL